MRHPVAATSAVEHRSAALLTKGFGAGFTGPLLVVGDASYAKHPKAVLTAAVRALGTFPGVAAVAPPVFNDDAPIAVVEVMPRTGPNSGQTKHLVDLIRDRAAAASHRYNIDATSRDRRRSPTTPPTRSPTGFPAS